MTIIVLTGTTFNEMLYDFFFVIAILLPNSLDNRLAEDNTASPTLTKVACRVRGHVVTPAARGTYGVHMKRTMREWSNSVCGGLPLKPKPFSQLFSPWGQNISCMLIFTG